MDVFFTQFLDDDLGCASYLVGDEDAGEAAVVDPPYAVEPVLEEAERRGVRLVARRSRRTRTPTTSPGTAGWRSSYGVPGARPPAGGGRVHARADGRRRPRSRSARSRCAASTRPATGPSTAASPSPTRTRAEEPWLVLTGDSLFVGDAARPDLAVEAREGAEGLFHSSAGACSQLADGVEVYPGHVAGSLCGTA